LRGISLNAAAAAAPPIVRKMPRTKNVPRRCEGVDLAVREQQRAAAALAAAPAPLHDAPPPVVGAGASGMTVKEEDVEVEEDEDEDEETPEEQRQYRLGLAPGPARMPASGPRTSSFAARYRRSRVLASSHVTKQPPRSIVRFKS